MYRLFDDEGGGVMSGYLGDIEGAFKAALIIAAVVGWVVIELLIWLFSFISITVNF
jgi:hypothetical protein